MIWMSFSFRRSLMRIVKAKMIVPSSDYYRRTKNASVDPARNPDHHSPQEKSRVTISALTAPTFMEDRERVCSEKSR